jgi:hypothetical protein
VLLAIDTTGSSAAEAVFNNATDNYRFQEIAQFLATE